MVHASHDGFRGSEVASGIHASITGIKEGDMELRDMSEKEMLELDEWIAENVMGWTQIDNVLGYPIYSTGGTSSQNFHPTILDSHAMDVLKKCAEKVVSDHGTRTITMYPCEPNWIVGICHLGDPYVYSTQSAETLELAICKFAKQLFSK